ncbi:hypothetical protein C4D60_Mb06t37360 [Musa balbisiana]|uniref:Uncharacterized protein n=1 Tax=Musa balbisiana TaxID=52838 RepID=A0A4V4H4G4_MUSBA|nr:hypothetical protein C4D60_Mb06t37360 [Musa balbisiana]
MTMALLVANQMNSVMRVEEDVQRLVTKPSPTKDSLMSIIKVCIHRDACMKKVNDKAKLYGYEGTTAEEETPSYLLSSHYPSVSIKIRWLEKLQLYQTFSLYMPWYKGTIQQKTMEHGCSASIGK